MKIKPLFIGLAFCATTSLAFAQTTEEDLVKAAARMETETYLKKDSTAWKAMFVTDEKTTRTWAGNGFCVLNKGWSNFGPELLKWMKENPKPGRYTKIEQENYTTHVNGNMASLEYDQVLSAPGNDSLPAGNTHEYRTMVKDNGSWKIVSIMSIDTTSFISTEQYYVEANLNAIGYNFLNAKKIKEAIEVFKLNVKLYPASWNAWDSLGEGYAANGDKVNAIKNYEQSVKLNPENDAGKKMLEKLKTK